MIKPNAEKCILKCVLIQYIDVKFKFQSIWQMLNSSFCMVVLGVLITPISPFLTLFIEILRRNQQKHIKTLHMYPLCDSVAPSEPVK